MSVLTPETDNRPLFVRTEEQARIDAEALRLRSRGWTFRQIAAEMDCSAPTAMERCRRALRDVSFQAAEDYRALEMEKLDGLERAAHEIAARHHVYVSASGKVVYDGDQKLKDDGPVLQAMNLLLKVSERRAKLLGLDAPVRQQIEVVKYDAGSVEARVAELRLALGRDRGGEVLLD